MSDLPQEAVTYDFSFSRTTSKFRWRYGADEWLCDAIAGKGKVVRTDPMSGHIFINARLVQDSDGTIFLYKE